MSRLAACPVAGVVLGATLLATGPLSSAAAAADAYPRVLSVRGEGSPDVSLDVVVPPLLASQPLPPSAFQITDGGRRLPVTSATRLTPSLLRVMVVIDTTVAPPVLAAQQGAAREFLFGLPPQVQVGVVAGGVDPEVLAPPTADRQATVRALVALEPQPPDDAVDVTPSLDAAVSELQPRGAADAVVIVDSRPAGETVPFALSRAVLDAGTSVFALLLRPGPTGYLGGLPALSGGRVLPVDRPQLLLNAFDTVQSDLLGRYRLEYRASGVPGRTVQLVVTAGGIAASTTFTVGAAARLVPDDDTLPFAPVAGALVAIFLAAVLVGRLATPTGAGQEAMVSAVSVTEPPETRTATSPAPPGTSARTVQLPDATKNRNAPESELTTSAVNSPSPSSSRT